MAINIQFRRGTASEWTAANPTLAVAEFGVETDTDKFKLGDGATAWTSLAYGGIKGDDGTSGVAAATAPLAYNSGTSTVSIDLSAYDTSSEVDTKLADYDTSAEVDTKLADYDTSAEVDTKLNDYDTSAEVDAKVAAFQQQEIVSFASSRSLATTDTGKMLTCETNVTVTVPSGIFSAGDRIDFMSMAANSTVTFTGSGVSIGSVDGALTLADRYAGATLFFVGHNQAHLMGKLA